MKSTCSSTGNFSVWTLVPYKLRHHWQPVWLVLSVRQGLGGKVKGGSPCNGIFESDIAKGGVASNSNIKFFNNFSIR